MKYVLTYLILFLATASVAQKGMDTVQFVDVPVTAFTSVKTRMVTTPLLNTRYLQAKRLNEWLSDISFVYLKNYGSGQLSSISVHGSGAAQTDILWNGIRMNQPSLGQIDLSLFSIGLHEGISIAPAAVSSTAIGGVLQLNNNNYYTRSNKVSGILRYGSFKTFESMAAAQYAKGKLWGATKFSYLTSANNFKYRNPYKAGRPYEVQQNAKVKLFSFFNELNARIDTHNVISAYLWINEADREIAPIMSKPDSKEHQYDEAIRTMLCWNANYGNDTTGKWAIGFTTAYLNEKMRYINPEAKLDAVTHSQVVRNLFKLGYIYKQFEFNTSLNYDYELVEQASYGQSKSRHLAGLKAEAKYKSDFGLDVVLGLAQDIWNRQLSPFSPSLMVKYRVRANSHIIDIGLFASRAFRFPTFNDLYWVPGGNPNLKTEKAWKGQLSAKYNYDDLFTFELTGFCTYATDWIQWIPQVTNWSAVNYKRVLSRGFDATMTATNYKGNDKQFTFFFRASYSYTKTTNLDGLNPYDQSKGKQLIYVPLHNATAGLQLQYRRFYLRSTNTYTSTLYTSTDNSQSLQGFVIANVEVGKDFVFGAHEVGMAFKVNNVGNADYQSVAQRPMPGRAYEGIIRFKFATK